MYNTLEKIYAQPHKIFLWIALFFGTLYVFIIPPFAGVDEDHHFARILALSQGKLLDAAILPKYFVNFVDKEGKRILDFFYFKPNSFFFNYHDIHQAITTQQRNLEPTKLYEYNRAVVYSPIAYFSALPIAFLATKLSLHPIIVLYLIRISIFVAATFMIYYAIKISPILKWHFLFLALLQTSVFVRSTASADPLTISYIFIFIAIILKIINENQLISTRNLVYISIISCAICLSKTAYILLPLLFFIIPQNLFTSKSQHIKSTLIIVVLPIIIGCAWFLYSSGQYQSLPTLTPNDKYAASYAKTSGTNEYEQIKFIIHNPINFIETMFNSLVLNENWIKLPMQFVAINGNGQTAFSLPLNLISLIICLLIIPLFMLFIPSDEKQLNIVTSSKLFCSSIYGASFIIICSMLYIANTEVGGSFITGLQGRYFIPCLPLLLLTIPKTNFSEKYAHEITSIMTLFLIALLSYSLFGLFINYYGFSR